MRSRLVGAIRRHRAAAVSVAVLAAVLVGVLVVPRGGSDREIGVATGGAQSERALDRNAGALAVPPKAAGAPTRPAATGTAATEGAASRRSESGVSPQRAGSIGSTRGVTAAKIRIGIAYADLEAFKNVSASYDVGDPEEQMNAVLAGWRREGLLPVHGRDIEFVYRKFDVLSSEDKIAACQELIEEEKAFAVIGDLFFNQGVDCVTQRFKTPLVTLNSEVTDAYTRGAPYLFTIRAAYERLFRNWIEWADANGHLKGKTIGLFYEDERKDAVEAGIKRELARRGYKIAAEISGSGAGIGSTQDQIAVQRFQQEDVDLAILVVGSSSMVNFTTFAESQRYRPTYIDTDYGEHINDVTASSYPDDQWDGTFAITTKRVGEIAAGMRLPDETTTCIRNFERFSGKRVPYRSPETGQYGHILQSCDMANVMFRGILAAGRALGHLSLVGGLENVRGMPLAGHGDLTFGPGRHYGISAGRTVRWEKACGCWKAAGPFRPFAL